MNTDMFQGENVFFFQRLGTHTCQIIWQQTAPPEMKSTADNIDFGSQSNKLLDLEGLLARTGILGYTGFDFYCFFPLFFNKSNVKVGKKQENKAQGLDYINSRRITMS